MNTGTLYGVGIGPGDPKLMTFRAAELIRDNEIIALPGEKAEETVAYQIAVQTVKELKQKTFLELPMPMTKDKELLEKSHEEAADRVEEYLKKGQKYLIRISAPSGTGSCKLSLMKKDSSSFVSF